MDERLEKLETAEQALRLVLAVRTHTLLAKSNPGLRRLTAPEPAKTTVQEQKADIKLELTREEEEEAAGALEHGAAYLAAQTLDAVLAATFEDRFHHANPEIRAACCIASILRDSPAENPFGGSWKIPDRWHWREFKIDGVITLDTEKIAGKRVRRRDFGGPLALLRLIDFVRKSLS